MLIPRYDLGQDFLIDEDKLTNDITLLYMNLSKALRIRIGHQFATKSMTTTNGFVHSCTFLEEDCNNERYAIF